uniref:SpoIIE family protein phosphatase n=1 Tax=Streptomyces polyasparticus TaxID=2767826 RepID=UPI001F386175|nr:SpoIIE family protein phosphatase [Streptomyces polyasparticus]
MDTEPARTAARRPLISLDGEAVLAAADVAGAWRLAGEYRVLRAIVEGAAAGMAVLDTELRYLYVNPHMARMNGLPAEAHLGRTLTDVLPGVYRSDTVLRRVLADGKPRQLIGRGRTLADSPYRHREWRSTYHRLEDRDGRVLGIVGIGLDVSGPRQDLRALKRSHRRLDLLDTATPKIGTTADLQLTCQELADAVVPGLADAAVVALRPGDAVPERRPPAGVLRLRRMALAAAPALRQAMRKAALPGTLVDYQPGSAIQQCLESGRPWLRNRISPPEWRALAAQPELADAYMGARVHSMLVVPLSVAGADGPFLGTLTLARAHDSPPFTRDDADITRELAARASSALERARRFSHEHAMALELQRSLLTPPGILHPGMETAARYLPADDRALIGGDWYDAIALPEGRILLVIGDVMGHGVEAAVAMSHYRSSLRALAYAGLAPAVILKHADRLVAESGFERVATCLLALVDPKTSQVTYANAGHLPPLGLCPAGSAVQGPIPVGPPLGTGMGTYRAHQAPLPEGGVLLLYTDGLVERRDEDITTSLERLRGVRLPADGPLETFLDDVLAAVKGDGQEDDIALLVARLNVCG